MRTTFSLAALALAAAFFSTAATAQNLPYKVAPTGYDWNNWYIGGSVGGSFAKLVTEPSDPVDSLKPNTINLGIQVGKNWRPRSTSARALGSPRIPSLR